MSLIAQALRNLLNGVSQRPHEQRLSSQAQEQKNGLSSVARGLMKRPPKVFTGKLTSTITGWATGFMHRIDRSAIEQYHVAFANGDVFVYDALTQTPVTVLAPKGKSYLTDGPGAGFRAATAGDTTVIVNRGKTVSRGLKKTPNLTYEALLYFRQADFGTTYTVTLNGTPVSVTTPAPTATTRSLLSTVQLAGDLQVALAQEPLLADFTFTNFGSTIGVSRADAQDFTLTATDGLADSGLKVVKGSLQEFADLPRRAFTGFRVQITGSPETALDNYWVEYDDDGNSQQDGVWKECPAPGMLVNFDELTMPHRLVRKGNVLPDTRHVGVTTVPTAVVVDVDYGSATAKAWDVYTPSLAAISASVSRVELRDHGTGIKLTTGVAAHYVQIPFLIDMSLVEPGNDVTVRFYKTGVEKDAQVFTAGVGGRLVGDVLFSDTVGVFTLTESILNTDTLEIKIFYGKNATPDTYRRAFFSTDLNVSLVPAGAREIRFSDTDTYPVGVQVNVDVDGTGFTYNVTVSAKTGAQIATALQPTIDLDANLVAAIGSTPESIKITRTNNVIPVIDVTAVFDETKIFYNPDLAMVANEHAGRTLYNISDGSSGTIASNDVQTITVTALAGGVDNKFQPDDLIHVKGTGTYFVFEPCPWEERGAGDLVLCPFPSFTDSTIADVAFYENRLAFVSGENVVFSAVGEFFRLFRFSAAQLLPVDMIDVKGARDHIAPFHSLVLWNETLYAIANTGPFSVTGEPALTASTIRIDLAADLPNSAGTRPIVAGTRLYLTRGKGGYTQVQELRTSVDAGGNTVVYPTDITQDLPKYIKGNPIGIAGDATVGFLAVLTDDSGSKNLYVHSFYFADDDRKRLQSSWSKWEFPDGQIVSIDMVDGKLGIVAVHSDGAFLSYVDLNVDIDITDIEEKIRYLDRRVTEVTTGVVVGYNGGTNTTTWTLPYSVATNGSQGQLLVIQKNPQTIFTSTRPAANQIAVVGGDYRTTPVYIGVLYEFRYKLSRLFFRNRDEEPETAGRTTIGHLTVHYRDTTDFDVTITPAKSAVRTKTVDLVSPDEGSMKVAVKAENKQADIELVNSTPGACSFSSVDWEGTFSMRAKRV